MLRTRFAPSPTGSLHIGGIRTFLYNYALTRQKGGKIILRIEDTDRERFVEGATEEILEMIKAYGMDYDEGPEVGGPYEPYIQSERTKKGIYKEHAEKLLKEGKAYYCFCSEERLEKLRKEQQRNKKQPRYDRKCRDLPKEEIEKRLKAKEPYVIRLKVPDNETIEYEDIILKKRVKWNSNDIDDQVLLKSDGYPTYHLAVTIDDILMKIDPVLRGPEWIPSTPKHILLFKAFGWKVPKIGHLSAILDPEGGKLSKRKGSVSAKSFLEEGYLPEAVLNFLMLLGWAPDDDRELFTLDEFIKEFSLERAHVANPVFDRQKLSWFNGEYIRKLSLDEFTERFLEWTKKYLPKECFEKYSKDKNYLKECLTLVRERARTLSEIPDLINFFYKEVKPADYDVSKVKGIKKHSTEEHKKALEKSLKFLESLEDDAEKWKHEEWEQGIRKTADDLGWKHGDLFMLLRVVVTGRTASPPLFECMQVLGREETFERLQEARRSL